jgi:branched-chain amino acid transport system ATP-binding protein
VHENLLVGGHSRRKGIWTIDKVYELFPLLSRLRQRQALSLSGGEQQALSIGRGLMANPRLLLLDEVSLGLAPVVVEKIYEAMPAIIGAGTTVLLVEQDVGQAMKFADRVTCMLEGRLVLEGAPGEISNEAIFAAYFGV